MEGGSESSVMAGRGAWWGRQKHSSGAQRPDEGDVQEKEPDPGNGHLQKQSW